jgi:hypothetical protein
MNIDAPLPLPPAITNYFQAANNLNSHEVATCFTTDGVVTDEDQEYRGSLAILNWSDEAIRKYQPQAAPTAVAETDGQTVVTATVSGSFPGSPAQLHYSFTLLGDKISALSIEA